MYIALDLIDSKESGVAQEKNAALMMSALPLCRQLRFISVCWRQCKHQTYENRFSRYITSCLISDLQVVAGGVVE